MTPDREQLILEALTEIAETNRRIVEWLENVDTRKWTAQARPDEYRGSPTRSTP